MTENEGKNPQKCLLSILRTNPAQSSHPTCKQLQRYHGTDFNKEKYQLQIEGIAEREGTT